MAVEDSLFAAIASTGLFGTGTVKRIWPNVGAPGATVPFATYQQVGGKPLNFMAGVPNKRNGRFQVRVWAANNGSAMAAIRAIEDALRADTVLNAVTITGAVAEYDEATKQHGARQDFGIWF